MKSIVTPFTSALIIGVLLVFATLTNAGHVDFGVLQWCVVILVALLVGWIIAMLLNVAIFAPVYWLLGRLQSKKGKPDTKHIHDA
jgi:riboflavin transporter FmnP